MRRLLFALCLLVACGPRPVSKSTPTVAPAPTPKSPPPSPARMYGLTRSPTYHSVALDGHRTLLLGAAGDRALAVDSRVTAVASSFAPRRLVGALVRAKGVRFVDEAGAIFDAVDPLGPLEKITDAIGARLAAAGKETIVALAQDGSIRRFAHDNYEVVTLPAGTVGTGADLRLNARGEGILALAPAAFLATHDDGATWQVGVPAKNGERIGTKTDGSVVRLGAAESSDPAPEIVDNVPGTLAATQGTRAFFLQSTAMDTTLIEVEAEHSMSPRTLQVFHGCQSPSLAVSGKILEVLCYTGFDFRIDGQPTWQLHRSVDAGASFVEDGRLLYYENRDVALWMSPDGSTVMVKGTCPSDLAAGVRCDGQGVVRRAGDKSFSIYEATEGRKPSFYSVSFGAGADVFAFGTIDLSTGKLGERKSAYRLFHSTDSGKTFATTLVPERKRPLPTPLNGEHPYLARSKPVIILEAPPRREASIAVAPTGKLAAFFFEDRMGAVLYRAQGDAFIETPMPIDGHVSFAGLHGLLVGHDGTYETQDAGASWSMVIGAPISDQTPTCNEEGCGLGVALRHGWDDGKTTSPPRADPPPTRSTQMLVCAPPIWKKVDLDGSLFPIDKKTLQDESAMALGRVSYLRAVETDDHELRARLAEHTTKGWGFRDANLLPRLNTAEKASLWMSTRGLIAVRRRGKGAKAQDVVVLDADTARIVHATVDDDSDVKKALFDANGVVLIQGARVTFVDANGKTTSHMHSLASVDSVHMSGKTAVSFAFGDALSVTDLTTKPASTQELELWPSSLRREPIGSNAALPYAMNTLAFGGSSFGVVLETPDNPIRRLRIDVDAKGSMSPPTLVPPIPWSGCSDKARKAPELELSVRLPVQLGTPPFWLATRSARGLLTSAGICALGLDIALPKESAFTGALAIDARNDVRGVLLRRHVRSMQADETTELSCTLEAASGVPAALERALAEP